MSSLDPTLVPRSFVKATVVEGFEGYSLIVGMTLVTIIVVCVIAYLHVSVVYKPDTIVLRDIDRAKIKKVKGLLHVPCEKLPFGIEDVEYIAFLSEGRITMLAQVLDAIEEGGVHTFLCEEVPLGDEVIEWKGNLDVASSNKLLSSFSFLDT